MGDTRVKVKYGMKTFVHAKVTVQGAHAWLGAPDSVAFLRSAHRHNFTIIAEKEVKHDNRDIEFISFAWQLEEWLHASFSALAGTNGSVIDFGQLSCEVIAKNVLVAFDLDACEVSEDGENSARVVRFVEIQQ